MTCINFGSGVVCVNPWGRLKLGNRYVWVSFHPYCGPSFSWDAGGNKPYDPSDEDDPIWPLFTAWLAKYDAAKLKEQARRAKAVATSSPPT